jgi:hypothetical protein
VLRLYSLFGAEKETEGGSMYLKTGITMQPLLFLHVTPLN